MTMIGSGFLFLMFFLHWSPLHVVSLDSLGTTSRSMMERLSFGKVWYVYIKSNIFDIVVHAFRIKTSDSNTTYITLRGVITQMNKLKILRYPCQSLNISFDRSAFHDGILQKGLEQPELEVLAMSKICGSISNSYGIIAPSSIRQKRHDKDLTWLWQVHVNQHFIINITLLSLESRFYPSCFTTRALLEDVYGVKLELTRKRTLGVFCPNNPPQSFYSSGNNVLINVHTWAMYEDFFLKNMYFNQWIGTVSFTYEILDNDLSFDPWIPDRLPTGKEDYNHWTFLTDGMELHLFEPLLVHLKEDMRNKTSYLDHTPYLFQIFESKGEIVYIFNFQSYLGATMAVQEGSLTCTQTQATLVAFEGPMVDITRVDFWLSHLQEWNCGHTLNATNPMEELKGRIGDMTILFFVKKTNKLYFYSLTLKVAFRVIGENVSFAVMGTLHLGAGGSSSVFKQKGTFFYSLNIESVEVGFIKVFFDHVSLKGYMDQSCTYGGLYIANLYASYKRFVGGMCSHKAATRFQRLYGRHGLTLNDRVLIYIKQYNLLFTAYVKLRFSLDRCFGLVNLHMHSQPIGTYFTDEKEQVDLIKVWRFYGQGRNSYYRWYQVPSFLGIKRGNGTFCIKLHYVSFDRKYEVVGDTRGGFNKVVAGIGNVENIRPSRISLAFWNMDEELKHFDHCLANGFRFFPDNENNEPYVLLKMPEKEFWTTATFAAKLALDKTCLILGGAFHIQVEESATYSQRLEAQCFSEVGGYMYDVKHPIIPQGVCGGSIVKLYYWDRFKYNRVSFQKPLPYDRCCHLNMLTKSTTTPCIKSAAAYRTFDLIRGVFEVQSWLNRINSSEIFTWRALCTFNNNYEARTDVSFIETCVDLIFRVYMTCDIKIYYRMSLVPLANNGILAKSTSTQQTCLSNSCYGTPPQLSKLSWESAQALCEQMNSSLVSVNSDAEWRHLVTHTVNRKISFAAKLLYIGYRTHDRESQYWVDGSPYAFQMWKQSVINTLDMKTHVLMYQNSKAHRTPYIDRQKTCLHCIDYIEPNAEPSAKCTAAVMTPEGIIKWTKVPCTKEHDSSTFICETQKSIYQPTTSHQIDSRARSYIECPPRTIRLVNTCIRVQTSFWRSRDDIKNICMTQNATLYHIPRFIALDDSLLYGQQEIFVVGFLQAMSHRWPGLADYEFALTDELLVASVNSTEPIIFRFTPNTISNVEINSEHSKNGETGAAHVVCEFPLSSVSRDCLNGHFTCQDGTCILEHYVCDGVTDCPDSSDEVDCDHVCTFVDESVTERKDCFLSCHSSNCTCSELYFHCSLGGCVPWSRVCDGVNDCPNNEDEHICQFYYLGSSSLMPITRYSDRLHFTDDTAPILEDFHCQMGASIELTLKNDLVPDCMDQSDESEYQTFLREGSKTTYSSNTSLCHGPEETTCVQNFPGVCYPRHLYCIYELHQLGTVGCKNGGHLSNCQYHTCPSQFKCPDAYCVPVHTICDGKQDCPDGEDESNCQSLSCPGFLLCRHDNICVHPYDVWGDRVKCLLSRDDKALTNVPRCPMFCSCLGYAISCKFSQVAALPRLSVALRILLLDSIQINISNIGFTEESIFLLDLQVTNASIDQLQPGHLSNFIFLKNLNISYNILTNIGPQTFSTLENLEKIDLSHNLLEALHPQNFAGLRLLKHLNLNHNNIKLISHCTFHKLHELQILKLSHNKLTHLGENVLCGLGLKELDVSYNSLTVMEDNVLVYSFQYLRTLNTTPKKICCHVPKGFSCYPMVKLTKLSSCSRLLRSSGLRGIFWIIGGFLSSVIFPAVAWYIYQIKTRAHSKSLIDVLLLILFASHLYVCIYFFTLLSVDLLSARYYSFFDESWRHHIACSIFHTLSYAFFHTTLFVCLMISCVRTIVTIYPFKANDISLRGFLISILIWFVVSICLGYSGSTWIFPEYKKSPYSALGLGVLLPGFEREGRHIPLHVLIFIIPNATVLFFFCFSQAMLLQGLNNVPVMSGASETRRKKAIHTSVIVLVLVILQYCPLLIVHIFAIFQVSMQANVEAIVTIWTLVFIPPGNVLVYLSFSRDFKYLLSRVCYCFHTAIIDRLSGP